ncbi:hypothetical protein DL93DRAFT_2102296 [Clavulina sp. PMI_390]|nr:hypothetical protein DL93DRAFT_2102296 [Clavulina sp. PMI_390]
MSANVNNIIGGHKATLARSDVSEEAKAHSRQEIERLSGEAPMESEGHEGHESSDVNSHVVGGYKATLSNERTSEQAKANAEEKLAGMGVEGFDGSSGTSTTTTTGSGDEHENRVMGGYKATLKNPNVSEEAKNRAAENLREAGIQA